MMLRILQAKTFYRTLQRAQPCKSLSQTNWLGSTFQVKQRGFHSSSSILLGRKTGSSALDPAPRQPSKKQQKRRTRRLERDAWRAKVGNPAADRLRMNNLMEQMEAPETKEFLLGLSDKLAGPLHEMMLPDPAVAGRLGILGPLGELGDSASWSESSPPRVRGQAELEKLESLAYSTIKKLRQIAASPDIPNEYAALIDTDPAVGHVITSSGSPDLLSKASRETPTEVKTLSSSTTGSLLNNESPPQVDLSSSITSSPEAGQGAVANSNQNQSIANERRVSLKLRKEANVSLLYLASSLQDCDSSLELLDLMQQLRVPALPHVVTSVMAAATRARRFEAADRIFDLAVRSSEQVVDTIAWTAKINNLTKQHKTQEAVSLLDQLIKVGVTPTPAMYTVILKSMVDQSHFSDAQSFWVRMHMDGVDIDIAAFKVMLRFCSLRRQAERAFFYLDEMQIAYGLQPNERIFCELLSASGKAPHFVSGFEDTILDAVALIEGQELLPSVRIYKMLIQAFAEARDPVAAEYYFWELQRKALSATPAEMEGVYASLLQAYAKAQSVGAKYYGNLGRYSKAPPRPPTPDEEAMLEVGPERVAAIFASGLTADFTYEKGKRNKARWSDLHEELEAAQQGEGVEHLIDLVRMEAAQLRQERGKPPIDYSRTSPSGGGNKSSLALNAAAVSRALNANSTRPVMDVLLESGEGNNNSNSNNNRAFDMSLFDRDEEGSVHDYDDNDGDGDDTEKTLRGEDFDPKDLERFAVQLPASLRSQPAASASAASKRDAKGAAKGDGVLRIRDEHDGDEEGTALSDMDPELRAILEQLREDDPELVDGFFDLDDFENLDGLVDDSDDDDEDDEDDEDVNNLNQAAEQPERKSTVSGGRDGSSSSRGGQKTSNARSSTGAASTADLVEAFATIYDLKSTTFEDPFEHMPDAKGNLCALQSDAADSLADPAGTTAAATTGQQQQPDAIATAVGLLDPKASPSRQIASGAAAAASAAVGSLSEVEQWWDRVHFGRPPPADYSAPLNVRRCTNEHRARLAWAHMLDSGLQPTQTAMHSYLSVFCEAQHTDTAYEILDQLQRDFGLQKDKNVYRSLIKMHVRNKNMDKAMELYAEMKEISPPPPHRAKSRQKQQQSWPSALSAEKEDEGSVKKTSQLGRSRSRKGDVNLVPDSITFGYLILAATKRHMLVEALQLLEHASAVGSLPPERFVAHLRSRCSHLGVKHPDMPPDPNAWVREANALRRRVKHAPQARIERVRKAGFTKR